MEFDQLCQKVARLTLRQGVVAEDEKVAVYICSGKSLSGGMPALCGLFCFMLTLFHGHGTMWIIEESFKGFI